MPNLNSNKDGIGLGLLGSGKKRSSSPLTIPNTLEEVEDIPKIRAFTQCLGVHRDLL
uniref:Uncharacterized protein n=1 Tax=Kwoniella bestiolae CBS 10118 TaxID=1296100 RepID=A0A1B9FV15_9TREE|nr:hypothetical protein I302_08262 [Kwoniella bestiolae CBS 10118]OCF22611.1 hypothetical protein I302_08262 [Kwoniella bestiolae CBS 10118]